MFIGEAMIFPDLIYTDQKPTASLDPIVFEDMKLGSMIREDITEVMRSLCSANDIKARQEIFRALDDAAVMSYFEGMAEIAAEMAELDEAYRESRCDEEKRYIFLYLIRSVCGFVRAASAGIAEGITGTSLLSRYIAAFKEYAADKLFDEFDRRSASVLAEMEDVSNNSFIIEGEHLKVVRTCDESLADRIRRCAVNLGIKELPEKKKVERTLTVDTVRAIAGLYPAQFGALNDLYEAYHKVYDEDICKYRVQLDFYIQIKRLMTKIASYGIPIRYPRLTNENKIEIRNAYDITLLTKQDGGIIPNDISFTSEEPFFYLTGANGGGKTTYLRTVGNAVLLSLCGCPVPCEDAELYPVKKLFTHFPRDERFDNTGRFVDEEMRIAKITAEADHECLVLLNETYSTTNEETATKLTAELADKLHKAGVFGIYITHQHGLDSGEIPYLNVVIDTDDGNRRTYKVARRKESGGSFARDILVKYRLTAEQLKTRFGDKA